MATQTTNYNLTKPAGTDYASPTPFNDNMDILDSALKAVSDKADANEGNITTLSSDKMGLVVSAVTGNIAVFDANGQVVDGGLKLYVDANGILNIDY